MTTMNHSDRWRASWPFYVLMFFVVPASFLVHEFTHWLTGEMLGYSMTMSFNRAVADGGYESIVDMVIVSAAGPLITIFQGVLAWLLIRRTGRPIFYPFLFVALFMRAVAMLVSAWNPNDEARISMFLGLGPWTLPAVVVAGMLALTWMASRKLRLHWTVNVYSYVVASIGVTGVVYLDAVMTSTAFIPG